MFMLSVCRLVPDSVIAIEFYRKRLREKNDHIKNLSITRQIAIEAYALLGSFHADPADRVIVATARIHNLTLLTSDKRILNYPHVLSLPSRS